MSKFTTGTGLRPKYGKKAKKNSENHIKLVKKQQKSSKKHVILHFIKGVPVKFMTMRTLAVQPRIFSKKNNFHLHANGGTQERIFNFVKIFFRLCNRENCKAMVKCTYTCIFMLVFLFLFRLL